MHLSGGNMRLLLLLPPPPNYNRLCARKNTHTFFEGGENVGWLADGGGKLGAIMWGGKEVFALFFFFPFPAFEWPLIRGRILPP